MLEDYEVECRYCGRRNMRSLEECPHCATPFDEDDDTEPTNECITCGLTFDLDDLDQDNECWGCVFSSGKEVSDSICYFCQGVPSDEDLELIANREYPSWLCATCIDYLENKGGVIETGLHEEPVWSWLCRQCDENAVADRLDICEYCQQWQRQNCDVCSCEKSLDDVVAGLYEQVQLCDDCICEARAERKEQNVGHCARCGDYASRVNTFAGPLCLTCNNRGEL